MKCIVCAKKLDEIESFLSNICSSCSNEALLQISIRVKRFGHKSKLYNGKNQLFRVKQHKRELVKVA
jgi:hypothetical protein